MNRFRWVALGVAASAILYFTQLPFAATMQSRGVHAAALERIHVAYRGARIQCYARSADHRERCIVEAEALRKRAHAAAEVDYKGTITAKADRLACGALTARERPRCEGEAAAVKVRLADEGMTNHPNHPE
jgi:hypothetical protein